MSERSGSGSAHTRPMPAVVHGGGSGLVMGGLCAGLFLMNFLVSGPWAGFHGVLLAGVGVLVLLRPARVPVSRLWWGLSYAFVLLGCAVFLPVGWFGIPEWRGSLENLGVPTGSMVVIQSGQALESLVLFGIVIWVGLWMSGHRATSGQLRVCVLVFTVGVACYAVVARLSQDMSAHSDPVSGGGHYGFFPNRNHSATYLAMGALSGLGCIIQALRDRRFPMLSIALGATAVCLWAIAAWSISRAGVVLVAVGCFLWVAVVGIRYLGRHGIWAMGIMALTAVGLFFMTQTGVRGRMAATVEKSGLLMGREGGLDSGGGLDFRVPVFRDTLGMVRDHPWTGVGGGQYYYIFPQYRRETVVANENDCLHPESDWLWMASELGVPATVVLMGLVCLAGWKSVRGIRGGRDRALRAGCLVAAMIVPVHGAFDVPGHRISLAWSAAFLFALSLPAVAKEVRASAARNGCWRLFALCLLAVSIFLIRAQWLGGAQPSLLAGQEALARAKALYRLDQVREQEANEEGVGYDPAAGDDPLEEALSIMEDGTRRVPLFAGLRRYTGFIALHFDGKQDLAEMSFETELGLHPTAVRVPLEQAEAWSHMDPKRSQELWELALDRADQVDRLAPGHPWGRSATHARIADYVRTRPGLAPYLPRQ